jgi:hypothetical protein
MRGLKCFNNTAASARLCEARRVKYSLTISSMGGGEIGVVMSVSSLSSTRVASVGAIDGDEDEDGDDEGRDGGCGCGAFDCDSIDDNDFGVGDGSGSGGVDGNDGNGDGDEDEVSDVDDGVTDEDGKVGDDIDGADDSIAVTDKGVGEEVEGTEKIAATRAALLAGAVVALLIF